MCKSNQDSFSFPQVYKIIHLRESFYTDDSGDYEHEYSYMAESESSYVIVDDEKERDDLYEYCAEPDIKLIFICALSHNFDELKDFSDKLLKYMKDNKGKW